jgi:hypothetical protein
LSMLAARASAICSPASVVPVAPSSASDAVAIDEGALVPASAPDTGALAPDFGGAEPVEETTICLAWVFHSDSLHKKCLCTRSGRRVVL